MKKHIATLVLISALVAPLMVAAQTEDYAAPDETQTPGAGAAAPGPVQTVGNTGNSPTQTVGNTGASPTQTVGNTGAGKTSSISNPLSKKFNSVGALIQGFVEIFTYLVIIVAVLALVWVGFQFILAQGKPDRLSELKNWLLYIVIGIAIVVGARVIINVVINTLAASGTVNQNVIQSAKKAASGN